MKKLLIALLLLSGTCYGQVKDFITRNGIIVQMRKYDSAAIANAISARANTTLSNLGVTSVNADLIPLGNDAINLGTSLNEWSNLYIASGLYVNGVLSISNRGMRLVTQPGDISSPLNGEIWYNGGTNTFRARQNAVTIDLIPTSVASLSTGRSINITGDLTYTSSLFDGTANVTGAGTIAAGAITLSKMANMATSSLIYRKTAGSGAPEVNTLATLKTDLLLTGTNSGDQTITLTGDATGSGAGSFAVNVGKINGTSLGGLVTGILKNTTTTGVPSIAVAGDFPTLNQSTLGSAATLTTPRAIYGNNFDGSAALAQIIASTYGGTGNGFAKLSGPSGSEKTYSLPNASSTILTDNALVSVAQGGTGIGAIGTGIATWWGTPSSANLASAITDETGSGVSVFGTSPTFTTDIRSPLVIGSTAANGTLTLEGNNTTGNTSTNANLVFKVGNSAATTAMQILNAGNVLIGAPTADANQSLNIQSITNTAADGIKIYALNLSANMKIGYQSLLTSGSMIVQAASTGVEIVGPSGTGASVGSAATAPTSTLSVFGSFSTAYIAKSANYTLTATDNMVEVTTGSNTQTLPTAVGITGREYVITNSGTGVVTVATTSSQTFVNVSATPTTLTLNQFNSVRVISNGANWLRVSSL